MEGKEREIQGDTQRGNSYELPHRPAKEENPYEYGVEVTEGSVQFGTHENADSDPSYVVRRLDPFKNSKNYRSDKSTTKAIVVLAIFLVGFFILSMVAIVISFQFHKKTTEVQEKMWAELEEMKGFHEKQKSEIMKVQAQDLKLNESVTFLKDQISYFTGTVSRNIEELHSIVNVTRVEAASLLVSSQSINSTMQQHISKIEKLHSSHFGFDRIRLVGGTNSSGRVEIFHNGQWGTICDDYWGTNDATVVCRMLGYSSALSAPGRAAYGQGVGEIWLDDVDCDGTETTILNCKKKGWGSIYCNHGEDASAVCNIN